MSDPKHPTKLLIMMKRGMITGIFMDKSGVNLKVLVADYDCETSNPEEIGKDATGDERYLYEHAVWIDSAQVRGVINKKGGK